MRTGRSLLGWLLAAAAVAAIAWLSQAPTRYAGPDDALLRLSWRVPGVRVEECRRLSDAEMEALAPHMRTAESCVGRIADYALRVEFAGEQIVYDTVHPGGARRDRPVYVFWDLPIAPGEYPLEVAFTALLPPGYDAGDATVAYGWEGDVSVGSAEIALITLDPSGTNLIHRTP